MLKIENVNVSGFESAIRGMRNPMMSWNRSDSYVCKQSEIGYALGENDLQLALSLSKAGNDHAKFLRYINVSCDIVAPDYWFKEFSTYKVGTVENSTSTMHKIQHKEFDLDDFSCEHLNNAALSCLENTIKYLNGFRKDYIEYNDKKHWWQMIQLLPMSYNYRRTVQMNYQVLKNMYHSRKNHKLDEWRTFCEWVEKLPYHELITLE